MEQHDPKITSGVMMSKDCQKVAPSSAVKVVLSEWCCKSGPAFTIPALSDYCGRGCDKQRANVQLAASSKQN
jgi:hypothetical protein